MNRRTNIWIYVLAIYVVIQLVWWGIHLVQLTQELSTNQEGVDRRVLMIIGEGCVFFIILLLGLIKIRSSMRKDREVNEFQKNFLLAVTHELKTPLASTQLNVQTLQKRTLNEDQQRMLLKNIANDTSRLSVLINNILSVTHIENNTAFKLSVSECNISTIAESVINRLEQIFPNVDFDLRIEKNVLFNADKDSIDSILTNLTHNAAKYAGEGNKVQVEIKKSGSDLMIQVDDSGIGIPDNKRQEVFKRFVRLENEETRSVSGSGIGLYLTKHLVDLHQGTIRVESSNLGGAKFIVNIKNQTL